MLESASSCPQCGAQQTPQESALLFCSQCRFPLKLIANKYRLVATIAEGGFGTVYRAEHIHLQEHKERAIKILKPEVMRARGMEARFYREVRLTASLSQHNEHIIRIYDDFGQDEHLGYYYVMEFLQGQPLADALLRTGMPLKDMLVIGIQLCQAIEAAHRAAVVHRDLKPENIFLTERPEQSPFVKVLDFGIAKPLAGTAHGNLTQGVLGTPNYMAPEQCTGTNVGPGVDIYAVGVIFFEMLAGRAPFEHLGGSESGFIQILNAHLTLEPPSLHEARPDLPASLVDLVHKMLRKDPKERPISMEQVGHALRALYNGEEMPETAVGERTFLAEKPLPSAEYAVVRTDSPSFAADSLSFGATTPSFAALPLDPRAPTGSAVSSKKSWVVPVLLGLVLLLGGSLGAVLWFASPFQSKLSDVSYRASHPDPTKPSAQKDRDTPPQTPQKVEPRQDAPKARSLAIAGTSSPTHQPKAVLPSPQPAMVRVSPPSQKAPHAVRRVAVRRAVMRSKRRRARKRPESRGFAQIARRPVKKRRVRIASLVQRPVPERDVRECERLGRRRRWLEAHRCIQALEEAYPRAARLALAEAALLFREHRCGSTSRADDADEACKKAASLFRHFLATGGERSHERLAQRRLRSLDRVARIRERRAVFARRKADRAKRTRINTPPTFRASPPMVGGYVPPELPAEEAPKVKAFVSDSQEVKDLMLSGASASKKKSAARALWSKYRQLRDRVHVVHLRGAASGLAHAAYLLAQPVRLHFLSLQMEPSDTYGNQLRSMTSAFTRSLQAYRPLAQSMDMVGAYCNIFLSAEAYDHLGRQVVAYRDALHQYRHLPTHRYLRTSSLDSLARGYLSSARRLYQTAFRSVLGMRGVFCRKDLVKQRAALEKFLDRPQNQGLR
ncbi:MAG: serine/threonine protein kinase [Myxococcales bacterium]|nr:serine/threonine protein kinase [Myxococcales bacterium]